MQSEQMVKFTTQSQIAQQIKQHRKSQQMTVSYLAQKARLGSPQVLIEIENGDRPVTVNELNNISQVLRCSFIEFLEEPMTTSDID